MNCCPSNLLAGSPPPPLPPYQSQCTEAKSKDKHGAWDPMPELTITSPYSIVHSRVDSNAFTVANPKQASTLTQCQSRLCPQVKDFENTDSVRLGWGGVLSCVGDHNLPEFNTLYKTRFRTYKIVTPPKQKRKRGGGLRQINTCRKVPYK